MTSIQKVIKILKKYPDLGNHFGGDYKSLDYFVKNGELKVYTNWYDYHGKCGDGNTSLATEKEASGILERLEKRLSKKLEKISNSRAVNKFYSE